MREPLKISFILTLTLVVLLTMLAAIYGAIFVAQRLTRPVQDLIAGTRAVGKGDFATRLPLPSRDEMGFLVHSFNDMTKRLRRASEEAERSRRAVERERERLADHPLAPLDRRHRDRPGTAGAECQPVGRHDPGGAARVLARREPRRGCDPANVRLATFTEQLKERLGAGRREWREQLTLPGETGERVLLWACTPLPG